MDDRELLERAARAAGIKGKWGREAYIERHEGFIPRGWSRAWNPLTNSGDALELAAKLKLSVMFGSPGCVQVSADDGGEYCIAFAMERLKDDIPATRRAIVRAAAALADQKERQE